MSTMRYLILGTGSALILLVGASANEQQKERKRPAAGGFDGLGGPLVTKEIEEKLKLTAEQKDKLSRIEKEFADKAKDNETKLRDLIHKARRDQDRAAIQQAQTQLSDARKVRATYEGKIADILTADQKKLFQPITGSAPEGRRPGAAGQQGSLLPGLQRLNLSEEQTKKLEQLQKDFEAKALQILTEEQRRRYEELKKVRRPQPE